MIWTPPSHTQPVLSIPLLLIMSMLVVCFYFLFLSLAGLKTMAHLPFALAVWCCMRLCGLICHPCVCVCVCVCCATTCVCVCVCVCVCACGVRAVCVCGVCVRVLWQSGATCDCADLFATRVRVMCHHVCVCVWCVVCGGGGVCVCVRVRCPFAVAVWCCMRLCGLICHVCVCTRWPFAVAVWDGMRLCGLICHPCVCVCA